MKNYDEISHVRCREIQAPLVAAVLEGFSRAFGSEKAMDVAVRTIQDIARRDGEKSGREYGGSMRDLARLVRERWCRDGGMVIDVLEGSDEAFAFNVTRCGYAEAYERLGVKEYGACLSCCRDKPFAQGFNPRIRLERTQTIMEGALHCDFRYVLD